MKQFDRKCKLELIPVVGGSIGGNALIITDLRVTFSVSKSMVSKAGYNKSSFSVTNLSEKHRKDIDNWGAFQGQTTALAKALLWVKYGESSSYELLSKTDLFRYRHSFDLPDIVTTFEADDGRLKGDAMVTVPKSASSKDPLEKLFQDVGGQIGEAMNAPLKEYPELARKVFATGYNFMGKANDCLTDLAENAGMDFHYVDDEPVFTPHDPSKTIGKDSGLLISEETGMIGIPERVDDVLSRSGRQKKANQNQPATNPGWEVKTLLLPKARPGRWARLISARQSIRGDFLIEQVVHTGDTHGEDWTSRLRLVGSNA